MLASALAAPRLTSAQDATPAGGGSRTIACDLPGASGTPAAMESSPAASSPVASPAVEFTPTPAGTVASEGMVVTVRKLAECVNSGNLDVVGALMTLNFIQNHLGVASAADVAAALAATERMRIRLLQSPETYDDGTASILVVYEGFLNTTGAVVAERWYFVVDGEVYKLDRIEPAELPPGFS
jgi:hypothetical protein